MTRAVVIAELARSLLPAECRHKVIALLHAFFDESGTHAGSPVVVTAGFVGPADEWDAVNAKWKGVLGGKTFHYVDCRGRHGEFERLSSLESEFLLASLAEVLSESKLRVVSGAFTGDWGTAIAGTDWGRRFPSSYHLAFEMCVEQLDRYSTQLWENEPIAIMFSQQDEYASRALEIWNHHKGNGFWQNLVSFAFGDPKRIPPLQVADMIVHETFQCLKVGTTEVFEKWPLVSRLLKKDATMLGGFHNAQTFIDMMKRTDAAGRQYLKKVPNP